MEYSITHRLRRSVLWALVALVCIFVAACGVSLAPGYQIQKESLTVHFVPGSLPHIAVRAEYRLANVGNAPLHFIGVEFPGEKSFGRANIHAEIDGKEITLQHNQHEAVDDWRIPMLAPWRQKEKLNLTLAYDLATGPATDPRIFAAANVFYLNDSGWLPSLMGFKAFLSPVIVRPNPTDLSVVVPADFHVTASGYPHGAKKQNGEVEYRFRIRKEDFDPYVIAGKYNEQRISVAGSAVVIWTFKPIGSAQAQQTAAQIAAEVNFDSQTWGLLPRLTKAIYDVELFSTDIDPMVSRDFLPGVIYNAIFGSKESSWADASNRDLSDSMQMQLGYSWFGHMIRPRPEAWLLSTGFAAYSLNVLDESQSTGKSRTEEIGSALDDYDNARTKAVEKPIISLKPDDPQDQIEIGFDKMGFFLLALEDKCGPENVRHAISDMVYALRGQQYGYSDFRAALEQECHQDLSSFFDTWLRQKGIPADFRARYENAGTGKQ